MNKEKCSFRIFTVHLYLKYYIFALMIYSLFSLSIHWTKDSWKKKKLFTIFVVSSYLLQLFTPIHSGCKLVLDCNYLLVWNSARGLSFTLCLAVNYTVSPITFSLEWIAWRKLENEVIKIVSSQFIIWVSTSCSWRKQCLQFFQLLLG